MSATIKLAGLVRSPDFERAASIVRSLPPRVRSQITPLLEKDWEDFSASQNPPGGLLCWINNRPVGLNDLVDWAMSTHNYKERTPMSEYV